MEAFHPICRLYAGMSAVSRHVWIRELRTLAGTGRNCLRLKDLDISRPLPCAKQMQLFFRRPQQLTGMCRDACFAALRVLGRFRRVGFATLRFFGHNFAAARFAARCFLTASRIRRRSASAGVRDSNFARGFFDAFSVSLRCLRFLIALAMAWACVNSAWEFTAKPSRLCGAAISQEFQRRLFNTASSHGFLRRIGEGHH